MTREEILAIRATGLALVAQCDAALARVESASAGACTCYICASGERCSKAAGAREDDCPHPPDRVINTAVPGFPFRGKCTLCGFTVTRVAA